MCSAIPAVRESVTAAFPTAEEAQLVDALRADRKAWFDGLSVAETADGTLAGHALFTRCHVDGAPAPALAPVAVLPAFQRPGRWRGRHPPRRGRHVLRSAAPTRS
ncbi:hypothetical protein [Streptomyces sp. CS227]|uniref:hypothetical protein n=1 Tax=Streptomyces sp. CS227 TaxID=1982763 RepID=UPI00211B42E8